MLVYEWSQYNGNFRLSEKIIVSVKDANYNYTFDCALKGCKIGLVMVEEGM